MNLEDNLAALTWRFIALYHTWNEKKAALKVGRAAVGSWADDLALEPL